MLVAVGVPSYGRSLAEMDAGYRQAGLQDYKIRIIDTVIAPVGTELHGIAQLKSGLGFKTLKIGSPFSVRSAHSTKGYTIQKWHFLELPSDDPEITVGPEEVFECWSPDATIVVSCLLVQGNKLAVAFGQNMRAMGVLLSKPETGFDPVFDSSYFGIEPIVMGIVLLGQGEDFAKAALTYFADLYGKRPLVSIGESKVNTGSDSDECKRVNNKKLADLTTQDLRVRKACAAPINDLLALMSSVRTTYVFESSLGPTEISVAKTGFGGVHVSIKMMHPKFVEYAQRATTAARAAMEQHKQREKSRQMKDF